MAGNVPSQNPGGNENEPSSNAKSLPDAKELAEQLQEKVPTFHEAIEAAVSYSKEAKVKTKLTPDFTPSFRYGNFGEMYKNVLPQIEKAYYENKDNKGLSDYFIEALSDGETEEETIKWLAILKTTGSFNAVDEKFRKQFVGIANEPELREKMKNSEQYGETWKKYENGELEFGMKMAVNGPDTTVELDVPEEFQKMYDSVRSEEEAEQVRTNEDAGRVAALQDSLVGRIIKNYGHWLGIEKPDEYMAKLVSGEENDMKATLLKIAAGIFGVAGFSFYKIDNLKSILPEGTEKFADVAEEKIRSVLVNFDRWGAKSVEKQEFEAFVGSAKGVETEADVKGIVLKEEVSAAENEQFKITLKEKGMAIQFGDNAAFKVEGAEVKKVKGQKTVVNVSTEPVSVICEKIPKKTYISSKVLIESQPK